MGAAAIDISVGMSATVGADVDVATVSRVDSSTDAGRESTCDRRVNKKYPVVKTTITSPSKMSSDGNINRRSRFVSLCDGDIPLSDEPQLPQKIASAVLSVSQDGQRILVVGGDVRKSPPQLPQKIAASALM